MDEFDIKQQDFKNYVVLSLTGTFASTGFAQLKATLDALIARAHTDLHFVVFDLSRTTLLTSSCLEVIYAMKRKGEQAGWQCAIVAPGKDIEELLEVTDFGRIFPIYITLQAFLTENSLH